ncbi:MAG: alpha-hydroxy-acid oxidizing protein [Fusobacteriaceae bacterium]|jgi:isopentenyl diphosphate isomerase/L-lactate dehydrogenase-like FMN-dependent dehydrogenase|nr:alpha-hydroxy-acid oxidizing protein [Fusobacteriaceae bacterium]
MDMKEIKTIAKEKMNGLCALCRNCDGVYCAGQVPGMGGAGSGLSFQRAYQKLRDIPLVMRTIHDVTEPVLKTELFGLELSFPCLGAPITGTKINMGGGVTEEEYCTDVITGAVAAGTVSMVGDTGDPACFEFAVKTIRETGGKGIAIIKPRSNEEILKRIRIAEQAGAAAVGMDIDGAGLVTMKLFGQPVGPKSLAELKALTSSTKLPFIVKGILSADEAKLCAEAGAAAIVVSNHGGRVLNGTLAPCEALPEIADAVGDKMTVLADGCVREGGDILKYLALGAKAVLVGRPLIWGSLGGRKEGVQLIFETLKNQLSQSMILTGTADVSRVDKKILRL